MAIPAIIASIVIIRAAVVNSLLVRILGMDTTTTAIKK